MLEFSEENRKKQIDPLGQWYLFGKSISSDLSIKPKLCSRIDIEETYKTLSAYFENRFLLKEDFEISFQRVNWLRSFLFSENLISTIYLIHTAKIIRFIESDLKSETQGVIKANLADYDLFRSYLFEAYVYLILKTNNVEFHESFIEKGKEKDGRLNLNGEEFLFECRKVNTPRQEQFLSKMKIQMILLLVMTDKKFFFPNGFIVSVKSKNEKTPRPSDVRDILKQGLKQNKVWLLENHIDLDHKDFSIRVERYIQSTISIIRLEDSDDIVLSAKQPSYSSNGTMEGLAYSFYGKMNHSISRLNLNKHILNNISKKIKQHSESSYKRRIIFLDLELLKIPPLPPISHIDDLCQNDELKESILRKIKRAAEFDNTELYVCFIVRDFMGTQPFGRTIVYSTKRNRITKQLETLKIPIS